MIDCFIKRMTVLGRGLVFQPVLVTQTCTYNSNNITLQNIDITDFPSKKKKKIKEHTNPHPTPQPALKMKKKEKKKKERGREEREFVCWLLNVPATCKCISGTDLLRQFYVLPH